MAKRGSKPGRKVYYCSDCCEPIREDNTVWM